MRRGGRGRPRLRAHGGRLRDRVAAARVQRVTVLIALGCSVPAMLSVTDAISAADESRHHARLLALRLDQLRRDVESVNSGIGVPTVDARGALRARCRHLAADMRGIVAFGGLVPELVAGPLGPAIVLRVDGERGRRFEEGR